MRLKHLHILINILLLSFITNAQQGSKSVPFSLLTTETEYEAGSRIILKFSSTLKTSPYLYISNSYGATLLAPGWDSSVIYYTIPTTFCSKTGIVNWKLLEENTSLSGSFTITPKKAVESMETYIGPPSINAGDNDYTMLVVIPTDNLDNPIASNTTVKAKHQFLATEKKEEILTNNLIAFQNIYAPKKSGRMLVSSECTGKNSNEYTINVMAAIPTNFSITAERPHQYADGNQITTFTTSIIKDQYENVVTDGTFVSFFITTAKETILKTSGTTVNGIATAKMIHPDHEDQWSVKAYVTGMAESDAIAVQYTQVIKDFEIVFSENKRILTVGPLQSFMKQIIPDGLQVTLSIFSNEKYLESIIKTSRNGYVSFHLKPDAFPKGTYTLKIKAAGIEKTIANTSLW